MKLVVSLFIATFFLTGCLKTRNDVRENEQRQVMQQQVVTLQRTNADVGTRFTDLEEEVRSLNGRVDVVENRLGKNDVGVESALKASQQSNIELNQKLMALQEALVKMEKDIYALQAELQAVKAERVSAAAERASSNSKKDAFDVAQSYFDKKDWKQAILNYQKYRDENPKGGKFADATYKIGVSFQELGMRDEAKTFYDEVVNKYPKSDEARRAKIRLKSVK